MCVNTGENSDNHISVMIIIIFGDKEGECIREISERQRMHQILEENLSAFGP